MSTQPKDSDRYLQRQQQAAEHERLRAIREKADASDAAERARMKQEADDKLVAATKADRERQDQAKKKGD